MGRLQRRADRVVAEHVALEPVTDLLDGGAAGNAERQRINAWVEEQTRNKIKELIPERTLTPMTRMVLVNAIYFKGEWAKQFDPKKTKPQPFKLADGKEVQVPMMHREGGFKFYIELKKDGRWEPEFTLVEIPYKGGELSFVVLLPGKPDEHGPALPPQR